MSVEAPRGVTSEVPVDDEAARPFCRGVVVRDLADRPSSWRATGGLQELLARHGIRVSERTVRAQLRRRGLQREALLAEPKVFGRYEAGRPNERWITDVLVGPWVPHPKTDTSVRAKLFLIVDDHSRLLVHGRFFAHENARACQECLRQAIVRRGLPEVLYADYADVRVMPTSERNGLWQKANELSRSA